METEFDSQRLLSHLATFFPDREIRTAVWHGAVNKSLPGFCVRVIAPSLAGEKWCFVSDGARRVSTDHVGFEFLITAPFDNACHVETLAMLANFRADPRYRVYEGKVIDIGRPWMPGSRCDHLLLSLPYPLGPRFEHVPGDPALRILWLMPITRSEAEFAHTHSVEELERRFEAAAIDILDPDRPPVV